MDRIASAVHEKICSLATIGRYVIISEDEFTEAFPAGADRSESELKKALKKLVSEGYVDLKYSGGNMYCVSPMKKFIPEPEPRKESAKPLKDRKNIGWLATFFAAFAGGAAGSLIISLIFALIKC